MHLCIKGNWAKSQKNKSYWFVQSSGIGCFDFYSHCNSISKTKKSKFKNENQETDLEKLQEQNV